MKNLKIPALLLSAAMFVSALSACGSAGPGAESSKTAESTATEASAEEGAESSTGGASGEIKKITWFFPDDMTDYNRKVYDKINEYTREKIGVEVDFRPTSWGEYGEKSNTILNSGQEFDIMFCNNSYYTSVTAGGGMPVEDYLKTVGKEMYETLPEYLWTAATINGHIYGVPTYKDNAAVPGIIYNKDLVEELNLTLPASFVTISDLNDLFYEAKEKRDAEYPEDAGLPILTEIQAINASTDNFVDDMVCANIPNIEAAKGMGSGERVFNYMSTPEYLANAIMVRNWVNDGIFPMDSANYDTERSIQNSGKIMFRGTFGYVSFPENGWSKDVRTDLLLSSAQCIFTDNVAAGVNLFGATSKNPEAAVAFMNLVNTDNFVANAIRFGIDGESFNLTSDNRVDFTDTLNDDPASRTYYKWYGWQFGSLFAMSLPAQEDDNLFDDLKKANEGAYVSDNMGFVFNRTPVQNEITACAAARDEFRGNLAVGMIEDVEGTVKTMNDKMMANGLQKILDEAQKQLNEWRAANGKTVYEG